MHIAVFSYKNRTRKKRVAMSLRARVGGAKMRQDEVLWHNLFTPKSPHQLLVPLQVHMHKHYGVRRCWGDFSSKFYVPYKLLRTTCQATKDKLPPAQ